MNTIGLPGLPLRDDQFKREPSPEETPPLTMTIPPSPISESMMEQLLNSQKELLKSTSVSRDLLDEIRNQNLRSTLRILDSLLQVLQTLSELLATQQRQLAAQLKSHQLSSGSQNDPIDLRVERHQHSPTPTT